MPTRSFRPRRRRREGDPPASPTPGTGNLEQLVADAKTARAARAHGYRERSLALHGWICGRCAREFEADTLHLLTVHHKDGNHDHNPPDGSNWENLASIATKPSTPTRSKPTHRPRPQSRPVRSA
jgi:hypothetical protein